MAEDAKKSSSGLKLGDISPLAGLITGEGLTSSLMGGIPGLLSSLRSRGDEEEEVALEVAKKAPGMRKGGVVKSASRGNGCAIRGKTKGRNR